MNWLAISPVSTNIANTSLNEWYCKCVNSHSNSLLMFITFSSDAQICYKNKTFKNKLLIMK